MNNIQNNSNDKLINLLSKKEEQINELKEKIISYAKED